MGTQTVKKNRDPTHHPRRQPTEAEFFFFFYLVLLAVGKQTCALLPPTGFFKRLYLLL